MSRHALPLLLGLFFTWGCGTPTPPCTTDCADDDDSADDDDDMSNDDDSSSDDDDSANDDDSSDDDDSGDDDDSAVPCNEATDPTCGQLPAVATIETGDYAYWYWPGNHRPVETWPVVEPVMHFMTGHYGMAFNEATGELLHLGGLTDGLSAEQAQDRSNAEITALPSAAIQFEAGPSANAATATTFEGGTPTAAARARLIDGGRFMNRIEIPSVGYAQNGNLTGRIEIASMPRHAVFNHSVSGSGAEGTARIVLSGAAVTGFSNADWLIPDRALTLTDTSGEGWLFVVYDAGSTTSSLAWSGSSLTAEALSSGSPDDGATVSLLAAPTAALSAADQALYLSPADQVTYTLLDPLGVPVGSPVSAPWEPTLGAFLVPLGTLQDAGGPSSPDWNDIAFHHWYGRHRIEIDPGSLGAVSVPLAMHGTNRLSWYITGGIAMLRDEAGEPTGIPVQISKNWHGEYWYHLVSQPTIPEPLTLELTMASGRWGDAYAASHAQLSLIGWGDNGGHWDESALGAFGESVTYDPDMTLQRAMIDDVRPFLVQSDQLWNWTGNVGGADFLRYRTQNEPYWDRRLSRVRSHYAAVGPNVTDVRYSGVSTDGKIEAELRVQLGATDDLVRVWYHLDFTFVDDVAYSRLAFFQVAADKYGDNAFARYAAGNRNEVLFDLEVPAHGTTGYASESDRGLALEGDAPWVMLYDNQRDWDTLPEQYADIGFVVRDFEANIGGTLITTPHINVHRTNNQQSQMAFELGLPYEEGSPWCGAPCQGQTRFIPAGSTVSATVEYLVPPADKTRYYGESSWLLALAPGSYRSTDMMLELAAGNDINVTVSQGTLQQTWPTEIQAISGPVAAEFSLEGGMGFLPITFHGLNRHDGWRLEAEGSTGWEAVDQSVHGNDFWQANFNEEAGTWSLTWSIENTSLTQYRLVWGSNGN